MQPHSEEPHTKPELVLSDDERKVRNSDIQLMCGMRDERDRKHPELDDMTYVEYYESNRKKDLSYIPPKKNKNDIRIVTGTTREKDTTLLTAVLDLNLEPNIVAFDRDDMMVHELGGNMADLVKKSKEVEQAYLYTSSIYRELISQGDVFVQEVYVDEFRPVALTQVDWNPVKDGVSKLDYRTRLQKVFSGCRARMVNGKKVYLGSVRVENMKDQPALAIMNIYKRSKAEAMYGQWERWKYVPEDVSSTEFIADMSTLYKEWNLVSTDKGEVGELFLYLPHQNRFAIYLNGVPMLPWNFPLEAISPSGEIPVSQGKFEPITDFAYSKGQPAKMKIDQEVRDEVLKLFVVAMRQMRKPPMGNTSKKVLGSSIFDPGKITPSLDKNQLFPLLPEGNRMLNPAEFSFYQLLQDNMNDKSVNEVFAGEQEAGDVGTLGQAQQMKQQQMLKLGLAIDGVMNLGAQMTWHRIYNILHNWTKPIQGADHVREGIGEIYRKVSVNTTLEDGEAGIKMFRFQTDAYPDVADQEQEEEDLSRKYQKPVRVVYMNPKLMRSLRMLWYVQMIPTPKSGDPLTKLLFIQMVRNAVELFGPESINQDYAKQRFAVINDENYNKLFKNETMMQMLAMQQQQVEQQMQGGNRAQPARAGNTQVAGRKPLQAMVR